MPLWYSSLTAVYRISFQHSEMIRESCIFKLYMQLNKSHVQPVGNEWQYIGLMWRLVEHDRAQLPV